MRAKDYFIRIRNAENGLQTIKARLRHYEDLGLTITSNSSAVGGRQAGLSRVELAAIGIVDASRDLNEQIETYSSIIREAEDVIRRIPQEKYRRILSLHYMAMWTLRAVSDELCYSDPNSIYRAHGYALMEAQKILDDMGK